jgi:hypothetical protein
MAGAPPNTLCRDGPTTFRQEENQRVPTRTAAAPRAFGCGVFGSMEGPNLVTFENNQTSSFWKALLSRTFKNEPIAAFLLCGWILYLYIRLSRVRKGFSLNGYKNVVPVVKRVF